jgi:hypothetical protein
MAQSGFKVMHLADIDFRSSCVTWVECLQTVQRWSKAHPRHVPILILINAKDGPLGPGSVPPSQGKYPTLRAAVLAGRWPTLVAFASGAQYISTDYFDPDPRFGGYQVRFAENGSARLNPVRAATACKDSERELRVPLE